MATSRLRRAEEVSALLFGGADPRSLSPAALLALELEIPVFDVDANTDRASLTTYDILEAVCIGTDALFKSKGDARRMVQQGGVYLNGQRMEGERRPLGADDLLGGRYVLVRKGARSYGLVEAPV